MVSNNASISRCGQIAPLTPLTVQGLSANHAPVLCGASSLTESRSYQICEGAFGSVHLRLIRTRFEQRVHQRILKPPVQLREVRFGQAGGQQRKAGAVMNEKHAVSSLDGEQIGVPAAERAFGLIISGIWERPLAFEAAGCVQWQFCQKFLCAVEADHRFLAAPFWVPS